MPIYRCKMCCGNLEATGDNNIWVCSFCGTKQTVTHYDDSKEPNIAAFLERGNIALDDSEWKSADEFFNKALNLNPKCAEAYLGSYLANVRCKTFGAYIDTIISREDPASMTEIAACAEDTSHIHSMAEKYHVPFYFPKEEIISFYRYNRGYSAVAPYYIRQKEQILNSINSDKRLTHAREYSSGELKYSIESEIVRLTAVLDERISSARSKDDAISQNVISDYQMFISSVDQRVEAKYASALVEISAFYCEMTSVQTSASTIPEYTKARDGFAKISGYKDAAEREKQCRAAIAALNKKAEQKAVASAKAKKAAKKWLAVGAAVVIVGIIIFRVFVLPGVNYKKATKLMDNGNYQEAYSVFNRLKDYEDSRDKAIYCRYNWALELKEDGDYGKAMSFFEKLGDYKDSKAQMVECNYYLTLENFRSGEYETGDTFFYGMYNGEMLEWQIITLQGNRVFAYTVDAVARMPYNSTNAAVTWSDCSLRRWLNGDFYNSTFTSEEKSRILNTAVNPGNNGFDTDVSSGPVTNDNVFLLTLEDVDNYLMHVNSSCNYDGSRIWWWLSTPGECQNYAMYLGTNDYIHYDGEYVNDSDGGVRPAIWINVG